jgi:hypothetical protein
MPVASLPPDLTVSSIFIRTQSVWAARPLPAYESFKVPCALTLFASRCTASVDARFTVRLSDGRTYAETVPQASEPATVLMRGGYITGPAGAPLGFYRRVPSAGATKPPVPPNLAPDPIQTIATVTSTDRAYDISLADVETVEGRTCYHLVLRPLRDPALYPLRNLWVETGSFDVVQLTYQQPFNATTATVLYRFAPVGPAKTWTIVHIEARSQHERVSEDLHDIAFPATQPPAEFTP